MVKYDLECGLPQSKVATNCGVSQPTVSKIANSSSYEEYKGFKPFKAKVPEVKSYFCRGKLVKNETKIIEDLENALYETTTENKLLRNRLDITMIFCWVCLGMTGIILILSLLAK